MIQEELDIIEEIERYEESLKNLKQFVEDHPGIIKSYCCEKLWTKTLTYKEAMTLMNNGIYEIAVVDNVHISFLYYPDDYKYAAIRVNVDTNDYLKETGCELKKQTINTGNETIYELSCKTE